MLSAGGRSNTGDLVSIFQFRCPNCRIASTVEDTAYLVHDFASILSNAFLPPRGNWGAPMVRGAEPDSRGHPPPRAGPASPQPTPRTWTGPGTNRPSDHRDSLREESLLLHLSSGTWMRPALGGAWVSSLAHRGACEVRAVLVRLWPQPNLSVKLLPVVPGKLVLRQSLGTVHTAMFLSDRLDRLWRLQEQPCPDN